MLTDRVVEAMVDDVCNRPEVSEKNRQVIRQLVEERRGLMRQLEAAVRALDLAQSGRRAGR